MLVALSTPKEPGSQPGLRASLSLANPMKRGQEIVSTDPGLVNILGRMDSNFEYFYFLDFVGSQISRFSGAQIPRFPIALAGPGLGPGCARPGPDRCCGPGRCWAEPGPGEPGCGSGRASTCLVN